MCEHTHTHTLPNTRLHRAAGAARASGHHRCSCPGPVYRLELSHTRTPPLTRGRPVSRQGRRASFNLLPIQKCRRGWPCAAAFHPHSSERRAPGEQHHLPLQPRLTPALSTVITWLSELCMFALSVCIATCHTRGRYQRPTASTCSSSASEVAPGERWARCRGTSGVDHIRSR